jgi:type II secretory pathway pseudopilin PulG
MTRAPDREPRRGEHGFTIVEVLVASTILVVGILGTVAALAPARHNGTRSEMREAATHRAEQEIEALRSAGYKALILKASPGTSSDPKDPRMNVSAGSPPTYRPSASAPAQPLVIDAADVDALDPSTTWQTGTTGGKVYRLITKDPSGADCVQVCPRRVTVAVTIEKAGAIVSTVTMSTLVVDPQDVGADENATPTPIPPQCPCWNTLYAYDTQGKFTSRQTPTADHDERLRKDYPDLMGKDSPPTNADGSDPPLYKYTADMGLTIPNGLQGYPGGAVVKQSGGCDQEDNDDKTQRWATAPLAADTTLTGDATFSFYVQTAGGLAGQLELCATVYSWTIDRNPASGTYGKQSGKQKKGTFGCGAVASPGTPELVTCSDRFLPTGSTTTVTATKSLGLEVTVRDTSSYDGVLLYDTSQYPSSFTFSSTPALP